MSETHSVMALVTKFSVELSPVGCPSGFYNSALLIITAQYNTTICNIKTVSDFTINGYVFRPSRSFSGEIVAKYFLSKVTA